MSRTFTARHVDRLDPSFLPAPDAVHAGAWLIDANPIETPGADGGYSVSIGFPALVVLDCVKDPDAFAALVAHALSKELSVRRWVSCPICGEEGMPCRVDDDQELIACNNGGCPSNRPGADWPLAASSAPPVGFLRRLLDRFIDAMNAAATALEAKAALMREAQDRRSEIGLAFTAGAASGMRHMRAYTLTDNAAKRMAKAISADYEDFLGDIK